MTKIAPRFNLLDEKCFPCDIGVLSMKELFTKAHLIKTLTGTPPQNLASMNLIRAVTEAAALPVDEAAWYSGYASYTGLVVKYLESRRDDFWLYHPTKPFLQDASLDANDVLKLLKQNSEEKKEKKAASQSAEKKNKTKAPKEITEDSVYFPIGALDFASPQGSSAVAFSMRPSDNFSDAEKSMHLITSMSFFTLTNGLRRTGMSLGLGVKGYLHSMFVGSNLKESIWLNIIPANVMGSAGMVRGQLCLTWTEFIKHNKKKISHVNELVPFTRRVKIIDDTKFLMIAGLSYEHNRLDTVTIEKPKKQAKGKGKDKPKLDFLTPNMGVRGYRYIDSVFQFIDLANGKHGCELIRLGCSRINTKSKNKKIISDCIGIMCSGVNVEYKSGSHAFTSSCRMMESKTFLDIGFVTDPEQRFYRAYTSMMEAFRSMENTIFWAVREYYITLKVIRPLKMNDNTKINSVINDCTRKWWLYVDSKLFPVLWSRLDQEVNAAINAGTSATDVNELVDGIIRDVVCKAKPVVKTILNENLATISAHEIEAISLAEQKINYFTPKKKGTSND